MKNTKQTNVSDSNRTLFLVLILNIMPLFQGMFFIHNTFALSLVLIALLTGILFVNNRLSFSYSKLLIGPGLLGLGAIIATIVTPSHGLAIWGCMRLVCLALYILLLMQCSTEERDYALHTIPTVAAVLAVFCMATYPLGDIRNLFFNNGRLWGFWGYCNAYTIYLMLALFLWLDYVINNKTKLYYKAYGPILIIAILWTGSRTILLITLLGFVLYALGNKKMRIPILIAGGVGVLGIIGTALILGKDSAFGRILTITSAPRTLIERFVFWRDGLTVLKEHPLGLGYKGFAMIETSIQTGRYATQYVHNDWLQIALDHGILGFLGFAIFFGMGIYYLKGIRKLLLLLLGLSVCMEFALQFYWMPLFLVTLYDWSEIPNSRTYTIGKKTFLGVCIPIFLLNTWFGFSAWRFAQDDTILASALYPWNWQSQMGLLSGTQADVQNIEAIPPIAESLLSQNPYNSSARSALGMYYHVKGDYDQAIAYGWDAVKYNRFQVKCYDNLIVYYDEAIQSARMSDNAQAEKEYLDGLTSVTTYLDTVIASRDSLAISADDNPEAFELSDYSKMLLEKYK